MMPPRTMVMSAPELQPRAMSESVSQLQPRSMMITVTRVTAGGHGRAGPGGLDVQELVLTLISCLSATATTPPGRTDPSGVGTGELAPDLKQA